MVTRRVSEGRCRAIPRLRVLMLRVYEAEQANGPEFTVAWGNAPGIQNVMSRLAEGHIYDKQRTS